ncbi:MAG TPA: hypothetical protein VK838_04170 [Candidatus Limnocylindrales bacterium]|nr:hypothetical protein [Candidatus Limnocylindrales bacterium]
MDELARRYLLLCLRLDRLVPGFIDSYNGPSELAEAVGTEPPALPAELHDEAIELRAAAAELLGDDDSTRPRGRWMDGQLRAIAALARRSGGEEIRYVDLLEQLFGMPIAAAPEAELWEARDRLSAALPGDGDLAARLEAHRDELRVAPDRVIDVLRASAARFREISRRDFEIPPGEGIDWEEAHDEPWGAYATFVGSGRTRIIINLDLPLSVPGISYLAAHEAYPGHHAEHAVKERTLVEAGVAEATVRTMNTPESMLAEGQADVGREIVMTDRELEGELELIGRQAGIRADWRRAMEVHRAGSELGPVAGNAALMLYREGRPVDEVRAWVRGVSALDAPRIDHLFRALADPLFSTYPFTYTEGARLIREWLQLTGQTVGFARLLSEQLSPGQLLAEIGAASTTGTR